MTTNVLKKCFAAIVSLTMLFTNFSSANTIVYAETPEEEVSTELTFTSVGESSTGTTYYVDGGFGDNSADGLSPQTAWRDFENVNNKTFEAGDHILLHAQSTWNNTSLFPKGSGEKDNRIVIDIYDTDAAGNAVYTTTRRPVINGNGTYSTGTFKRAISGTVQLVNQEYWTISNLEVTNSPELDNLDGYKKPGDAQRAGILILGYEQDRVFNSITVNNNYVHDVQTEYYLNLNGNTQTKRLKAVGGIIILGSWFDEDGNIVTPTNDHRSTTGFNNVLIENNIIQRVGLEGIRTKADSDTSRGNTFHKTFTDIVIKDNYLEDISGDGIVLSEIVSGGVVDGNVAVRVSNADYGNHNYAGVWAMSVDDGLFKNNEVYGIQFGYNDGEAFDIDMGSSGVIYEYNYSHHNTGGFMLLMSDQRDSIIRYNVSANDGGGSRGTKVDNPDGSGGSYTYKEQSIFHYWVKNEGRAMPLIHNNTFYVGDGVSTSLFGEGNSSDNSGTVAHFHNNILYKEGEGQLRFLTNYPANGGDPTERKMVDNPEYYFKNNIIWPKDIASETSGATVEKLIEGGNIFENPKLAITDNEQLVKQLADQEFTTLSIGTEAITSFVTRDRLRERASLFKLQDDSPAIAKGLSASNTAKTDFFGTDLTNKALDIGFHQVSNVERVMTYEDISIELLTATGVYPSLPNTLDVSFTETVEGEVVSSGTKAFDVTWDYIAKDIVETAGTVEVSGHIEGIGDDAITIKATITFAGNLGEGKDSLSFDASQTAFIQKIDGDKAFSSVAGKTGNVSASEQFKHPYGKISFLDNYVLKMKNAANGSYNRRIYVEIDTEHLDDYQDLKNASLQLRVTRYDAWTGAGSSNDSKLRNTQFQMDVYAVDSTWKQDEVTWNNGPGNANVPTAPLVASNQFTNGSIIDNQNIINVDISSYMLGLLENGNELPDKVSFLLAISDSNLPGYNPDNSGFDAFSTEGAAKAFELYEAGQLTLPEGHETMTPKTLAPRIVFSNVYEKEQEVINVESEAGVQPQLPENVKVTYSDDSSVTAKVSWPVIDPSLYSVAGEFEVYGKAEGIAMPIVATVKITSKQLVSYKPLEIVDRFAGTTRFELDLPEEVIAILDDGSEVTLPVIAWDDDVSNYSPSSEPGIYSFPAGVEIPLSIVNPHDVKAVQTVRTHAEPESITFENDDVTIPAGQKHQIMATVKGKEPFTEADAYSSQLSYELMNVTRQSDIIVPTVDENGLITVSKDASHGDYAIEVTSLVKEGVRSVYSFSVSEQVNFDKEDVTELLGIAGQFDTSNHPDTIAQSVKDAISFAEATVLDEDANQDALNDAYNGLKEAIEKFEQLLVNKEQLNLLIDQAEALDTTKYTEQSVAILNDALSVAQAVIVDVNASELDVNNALSALKGAIDSLVEVKPIVDKSELQTLIAKVDHIDLSGFTQASKDAFKTALEHAKEILTNVSATQVEVTGALDGLQSAYDRLVELDSPVKEVDKTQLQSLVDKAKDVDGKKHTNESFEGLTTALADAQKVLANVNASTSEVQAVLAELQKAYDDLELIKAPVEPINPDKTGDSQGERDEVTPPTGIEQSNSYRFIGLLAAAMSALVILKKRKRI